MWLHGCHVASRSLATLPRVELFATTVCARYLAARGLGLDGCWLPQGSHYEGRGGALAVWAGWGGARGQGGVNKYAVKVQQDSTIRERRYSESWVMLE